MNSSQTAGPPRLSQRLANGLGLVSPCRVRLLQLHGSDYRQTGIVSLGDLAVKTRNDELVGEAVEAISEPVHA